MSSRKENRLNLGCILGNIRATIVTRCGIVYQGTVEDWDCGRMTNTRPDSSSSDPENGQKQESTGSRREVECGPRFIRLTVDCIPGNICCPVFDADSVVGASRVTPILGVTGSDPLYEDQSPILINWDDISSIGLISGSDCLTDATP